MSSEIKASSLDFGTIIAFVAPGFIGFYALSYHVSTARGWLDAASNKEQSVGVFLMVLLASIAIASSSAACVNSSSIISCAAHGCARSRCPNTIWIGPK